MDLDKYFADKVAENPVLADTFAQAEAELRLAILTASQRETQGLTQRELAEKMGVSQAVVGRFETAGRTPSVATLWKIASALGISFTLGPDYYIDVQPRSGAGSAFPGVRVVDGGGACSTIDAGKQPVHQRARRKVGSGQ